MPDSRPDSKEATDEELPLRTADIWWLIVFGFLTGFIAMLLLGGLLLAFVAVSQAGNPGYDGWKNMETATVAWRHWIWGSLKWWALLLGVGVFAGCLERYNDQARIVARQHIGFVDAVAEAVADAEAEADAGPEL
jgi:hypothetical protein